MITLLRSTLAMLAILLLAAPSCLEAEQPATPPPDTQGGKIVAEARKQIGVTIRYDPAYVSLEYPGGDIPRERGVCSDVLIRALRDAHEVDLQKLIHEDMRANFPAYPETWGLTRTDRNIDHRRVLNIGVFLKRRGCQLPLDPTQPLDPAAFQPGDIVTCTVPTNLPHVMIVSHIIGESGLPLVIHNIGAGTREEDVLGKFSLTGHYRWK